MKYFTLGEIHRNGFLKNRNGLPYTSKGTISGVVSKNLAHVFRETAWGLSKSVPESEIDRWNNHWKNGMID
jgi:hypothetical protein